MAFCHNSDVSSPPKIGPCLLYYNTTYDISVKAKVSGAWSAYGPSCPITSPSQHTPTIRQDFCGTTIPVINKQFYATPYSGATEYEFKLVPQNGGSTLTYLSLNTLKKKILGLFLNKNNLCGCKSMISASLLILVFVCWLKQ